MTPPTSRGIRLAHVGLGLREDEARELREDLDLLVSDSGLSHEHVSSADYQVEMTVWLDRGQRPGWVPGRSV